MTALEEDLRAVGYAKATAAEMAAALEKDVGDRDQRSGDADEAQAC